LCTDQKREEGPCYVPIQTLRVKKTTTKRVGGNIQKGRRTEEKLGIFETRGGKGTGTE